jgi:O-antigen ligase
MTLPYENIEKLSSFSLKDKKSVKKFISEFVFFALIFFVALIPLPFGANVPWVWSLSFLYTIILILLFSAKELLEEKPLSQFAASRLTLPAIFCGMVIIWAWLQNTTDFLGIAANPIWILSETFLGKELSRSITIDSFETSEAVIKIITSIFIFFLSACYSLDEKKAKTFSNSFVIFTSLYSAYGLIVFLGGFYSIIWFEKIYYKNDLTSTFINRNNFATYAGLGLIVSFLMFAQIMQKYAILGHSFRQVIIRIMARDTHRFGIAVIGMLLNASALLLTHSRAGALSTLAGLVVAVFCLRFSKLMPEKFTSWIAIFAVIGVILIFSLSGEDIVQRFDLFDRDLNWRTSLYMQVWEGIKTAPLTGYGFGTFKEGIRLFSVPNTAWATWSFAHNTYLELAFTIGILGAAVLLIGIGIIIFHIMRGVKNRRRCQIYPIMGLAVATLIGMHSLFDFSVQIPAVGWSFSFLLGVAWAQSWSSQKK